MADLWVKFHSALTKGSKRALSRATRFVFLELCLQARDLDGSVEIRADLDVPAAVYDIIGGNLTEIAEAVAALTGNGMVRVEDIDGERFVTIPSWERWNRPDTSTDRVKRHRERKRDETHGTFQRVTGRNDVNALEERRGEEKRGEEEETRARETPPPPPPAWPEEQVIRDVLTASPFLSGADGLVDACRVLAGKVRALDLDVWPNLAAEVESWLDDARGQFLAARKVGDHWTPELVLNAVERKAKERIRYRPKDARLERERDRAKAATWRDGTAKSPASLETDTLADEIAEADRRLAEDRARRESEPKVDPKALAALVGSVAARMSRAS